MTITHTKHQLSGNWTMSGIVGQLELLTDFLQKLVAVGKRCLHIDCGRIDSIDMSGLQLIHVWIELVKMRGVETRLVNLPENMRQVIRCMGLGQSFQEIHLDAA